RRPHPHRRGGRLRRRGAGPLRLGRDRLHGAALRRRAEQPPPARYQGRGGRGAARARRADGARAHARGPARGGGARARCRRRTRRRRPARRPARLHAARARRARRLAPRGPPSTPPRRRPAGRDLSTCAGHIENLARIAAAAGPGALVLLDEPGAGTDPVEGAALAVGLLTDLLARGPRLVFTSHFPQVKTFALAERALDVAA